MKIDLHVHSVFSNSPSEFMLKSVKTGECYTTPKRVYDLCKGRGMDMVTLTDHDTVNGALEIAHLPGTFLSEEITASFPEDGMNTHVVALDITESQHREIQRLKGNIYELASYMRGERIPHFAAHPLSGPNGELTAAHVRKQILLFEHLEGYNGTRDREVSEAIRRIVFNLTKEEISRWADMYDLQPVSEEPRRFLTAGSDDHGAIGIGRCFTCFDTTEFSASSMRDAFFNGRIEMGGSPGDGRLLSHSIYSVTMQYFQNSSSKSAFDNIVGADDDGMTQGGRGADIARLAAAKINASKDLNLDTITGESHTDDAQRILSDVGRNIIREVYRKYTDELFDAASTLDLERAFDAIPGLLSASSLILPYLFGYRHAIRDRETAERISEEMGQGDQAQSRCRVAIFSDTGFDINGVSLGLRRLVSSTRAIGHDVRMVLCSDNATDEMEKNRISREEIDVLEPIKEFTLPFYDEMKMGIPSLVDVLDYLANERIRVVQVSTPGPLGLVALFAARLCGLPVVANYHTELAQYASHLTGDVAFSSLVKMLVGQFYKQADRVIVPSHAAASTLLDYGVEKRKIHVIQRGVDTERFRPSRKDSSIWAKWEMNGVPKVVYVGRVSREKGIDVLLEAFDTVKENGLEAELAIVGDGPYLEELQSRNAAGVTFTGYRTGLDLAKIFASADVFAFPSATDTFGNVVLEAQASGLPSVVVDKGGPAEQVTPDCTGYVVPSADGVAFSEALGRLLSDRELREDMGANARKRALGLSMEAAAEAHWDLYYRTMCDSVGAKAFTGARFHADGCGSSSAPKGKGAWRGLTASL